MCLQHVYSGFQKKIFYFYVICMEAKHIGCILRFQATVQSINPCGINVWLVAHLVLTTAAQVICAQGGHSRAHWPGDLVRHRGSVAGGSQQVVQTAVGSIIGGWF